MSKLPVQITIHLYKLEDLPKETQIYAITTLADEVVNDPEFGELLPNEALQLAEELIGVNSYYFYNTGEIANTITYTDDHERSGQIDLIHNGITYTDIGGATNG